MSVVISSCAGFVTTFGGQWCDFSGKDGDLADATFSSGTEDIFCLADGSMLLTDTKQHTIRLIQSTRQHQPPSPTPTGEGTGGSGCHGERRNKSILVLRSQDGGDMQQCVTELLK